MASKESFLSSSDLEISGEQFGELLELLTPYLKEHLDSLPDQPTWSTDQFQNACSSFELAIGSGTESVRDLFAFLFKDAIPCTFNTASHGYLAYIPGGGLPLSSIADLISTLTNRYVGVWAAAPVLANIEQAVIRWFCNLFGYPDFSGGLLTSGGSLANWTAMVAARIKLLGEEFLDGVVYCSDQAHHCIAKAAKLCGVRQSLVRVIESDSQFRMDPAKLELAIQADLDAGLTPFFVAANGGSTNSGAVDPLKRIAGIAQAHKLWFHVDAAYGGFFILTSQGRSQFEGIEQADSVVIDPHKGMFLPYGTGALIVKDVQDLSRAHRIDADYMPDYQDDQNKTDFHEISPELSRDFRGLRVWLPLKVHGVRAFENCLNEKLDLTDWIYNQLVEFQSEHSTIEIIASPQLSVFAFRVRFHSMETERDPVAEGSQADESEINEHNRQLLERINAHRRVYLTSTMLDEKFVIRICVLSFRTHLDRMQECKEIILDEIRQMESEMAHLGRPKS